MLEQSNYISIYYLIKLKIISKENVIMEDKIVLYSTNLIQENRLTLNSEPMFSNGLLKKPTREFQAILESIFSGEKYDLFRTQVLDLFIIDQNISDKIDDSSIINKIFLLEIKIFKKNILKLLKDANPEQEDLLTQFLELVNKNLDKINNILETDIHLPETRITQIGSSLVKYNSINLSSTKNFIATKWLESVDEIFESEDLEKSINNFVLSIFKENGFKLIDQDNINISQIIKSMCVNLEVIEKAKSKLEIYNRKYVDLGLSQSIKSISSIKKTSVLLLTKTFLDKYLDQLMDVVEHKISSIEKILDGGDKKYRPGIKYLKYKIEYLINKKI